MSEHLGLKIKHLREAAKLQAAQLADIAGIHVSQLELIENGTQIPSMATLIKLSRALQVRLGTILDGQEHSGPVKCSLDEQKQAISFSNDNEDARKHLQFYSLAQRKIDRNMDPLIVSVSYAEPSRENMSMHEGEEFLYVLEGEIELRYGSENYGLKSGESIYYDSLVPHCVSTLSKDAAQARVIAVTYTPY